MILWELFIGFLKVGLFAFGGAYGAIPLIRDVVLSAGWMDDAMLAGMIEIRNRRTICSCCRSL